MFYLLFSFQKCNVNPVINCFGYEDSYCIADAEKYKEIFYELIRQVLEENSRKMLPVKFIATRRGEANIFPIKDIYYFESFRNLNSVNSSEGNFEFYGTLKQVEAQVKALGFLRINQSYLISLGHIRKARARQVVMDDGKEIQVGRKYLEQYRRELNKWNMRLGKSS